LYTVNPVLCIKWTKYFVYSGPNTLYTMEPGHHNQLFQMYFPPLIRLNILKFNDKFSIVKHDQINLMVVNMYLKPLVMSLLHNPLDGATSVLTLYRFCMKYVDNYSFMQISMHKSFQNCKYKNMDL